MDAVAKILYEDTFMAFMEVPTLRAAGGLYLPITGLEAVGTSLGDLHYYEVGPTVRTEHSRCLHSWPSGRRSGPPSSDRAHHLGGRRGPLRVR
jgi:hypothetical protein